LARADFTDTLAGNSAERSQAMALFNELKRRNVFRVGAAYVVASWVLIEGGSLILEILGAPDLLGIRTQTERLLAE
jgi:hypothetical protein